MNNVQYHNGYILTVNLSRKDIDYFWITSFITPSCRVAAFFRIMFLSAVKIRLGRILLGAGNTNTRAGLFLLPERSENGNGITTMSPFTNLSMPRLLLVKASFWQEPFHWQNELWWYHFAVVVLFLSLKFPLTEVFLCKLLYQFNNLVKVKWQVNAYIRRFHNKLLFMNHKLPWFWHPLNLFETNLLNFSIEL